jgi:aminopeptidase N
MMQTLVGRSGFAKGMTLYFARFDGQAVTCDDFAQAVADANPDSSLAKLLPQFKRWYSQAGTPRLQARGDYNAIERTYTLSFSQSCPATPGQDNKEPCVIPVNLGLIGASGGALPLHIQGELASVGDSHLMVLTQAAESITFENVIEEPVPSILRGFSAPVILDFDYTDAQLLTLLAHDTDPFNRWEAGQRLALRGAIQSIVNSPDDTRASGLNHAYVEAMRSVLRHPTLDAAFKELVLTLPSETYIAEQLDVVDPQRIHAVREAMREQLALELLDDWAWAFEAHKANGSYRPDTLSSGRRALAGLALNYLCLAARSSQDVVWPGKAYQRFKDTDNMTDRLNALAALVHSGHELAKPALARFHSLFKGEELVLDKWFALQASCSDRGGQVLPAVRALMKHADFNLKNPNRARSVIVSYCNANPGAFHRPDGAGYAFWSEQVLALDAINPQVASRLARALDRWKKLAEPYSNAAREALKRVAAKADLSNDVREVITRALAD